MWLSHIFRFLRRWRSCSCFLRAFLRSRCASSYKELSNVSTSPVLTTSGTCFLWFIVRVLFRCRSLGGFYRSLVLFCVQYWGNISACEPKVRKYLFRFLLNTNYDRAKSATLTHNFRISCMGIGTAPEGYFWKVEGGLREEFIEWWIFEVYNDSGFLPSIEVLRNLATWTNGDVGAAWLRYFHRSYWLWLWKINNLCM